MEDLYDNIGAKIKALAIWICAIGAIGSVICGLILFVQFAESEQALAGFFAFILIAGIGSVAAFIGSWCLYAYGEITEKSVSIEQKTTNLLQLMNTLAKNLAQANQQVEPQTKQQTEIQPKQPERPQATPKNARNNAPAVAEIRDGLLVCPSCQTSQQINRTVCWRCGQRFVQSNADK